MDKQSLLQLLAENQLDELFSALKNRQNYYSDLVLLESQWNDLRAKQRNGLISGEQGNIELSRIRKSLLELIEIAPGVHIANPSPARNAPNRTLLLVVFIGAGLFILYQIYMLLAPANIGNATAADDTKPSTTLPAPVVKPAASKPLDVSGAQPITLAPGDFQYERVYTLLKTSTVSTGGGKSLITFTVGLNFKGNINTLLSTEKFRLTADELPGPLAPTNYLGTLVDSKSYAEGDIKFELSDQITRFSIIIEGKEDKKWNFSR